jgi:hypothetical protein
MSGVRKTVGDGMLSVIPWVGPGLYRRRFRTEMLRGLVTEYKGFTQDQIAQKLNESERSDIADIEAVLADPRDKARADDIYVLQQALVRLYSEEQLRRRIWDFRCQYRDVAGEDAYKAYIDSKPPDPSDAACGESLLRADAQQLVTHLQRYSMLRAAAEWERNRLAGRLAFITLLVCIPVASIIAEHLHPGSGLGYVGRLLGAGTTEAAARGTALMIPVIFAGALGGLVSLQQRLHNINISRDPARQMLGLGQSWYPLYYSPIMGALGAVLLVVCFATKLVEGTLFPSISLGATPANGVIRVLDTMQLNNDSLVRLLLWSFLAGFSERLVPDTLDRLVARADGSAQKDPPHATS